MDISWRPKINWQALFKRQYGSVFKLKLVAYFESAFCFLLLKALDFYPLIKRIARIDSDLVLVRTDFIFFRDIVDSSWLCM